MPVASQPGEWILVVVKALRRPPRARPIAAPIKIARMERSTRERLVGVALRVGAIARYARSTLRGRFLERYP